jgi:CRP-like cAMP-binding protein/Fe-S-cluster-containing dehydrogenase component
MTGSEPESSAELDRAEIIRAELLFADTPAPAFKKLEPQCRFETYEKNATIFEQDEYTGDVYVVLTGLVGAYRGNSRGQFDYLTSLPEHSWFGELSAISNAAREMTVIAETRVNLLRVPRAAFMELYGAKAAKDFRERVDKLYQERVLHLLLKSISLFRGLANQVLQKIAESVVFERVDTGTMVIQEGDEGKDFFLVRSGNLKVTRKKPDGRDELLAYLSDNSFFGEVALIRDVPRSSDVVALTSCDLVRIPVDSFQAVLKDDPKVRDLIFNRVKNLYSDDIGEGDEDNRDLGLQLLIQHEVLKGGEALVIDMTKCTHCNMCITGCIEAHDDRIPRIGKRGIDYGDLLLTSSCYSCTVPECMLACKFGAIRRSRDGQVHIDPIACTGCTLCEPACPYGTIHMQSLLKEQEAKKRPKWVEKLASFPLLHKLLEETKENEAAEEEEVVDGRNPRMKRAPKALAVKCDFCAGRAEMACIYNCPCGAIDRIDPRVLLG